VVGDAVVAQDVAEVPEPGDDVGGGGHGRLADGSKESPTTLESVEDNMSQKTVSAGVNFDIPSFGTYIDCVLYQW